MAEYKDKLAKRLSISILTADGDVWDAHCRAVEEREAALFDHFGIERSSPDAWRKLAMVLARRHVPAFMPEKGRPATIRDETLTWLMASLYFQRRDGTNKATADRMVAKHFDVDAGKVSERLKEMRKRSEYKDGGPLLSVFTKIETELGRSAMLDALAEALMPDPDFTEYVESEAQRLRRHPY